MKQVFILLIAVTFGLSSCNVSTNSGVSIMQKDNEIGEVVRAEIKALDDIVVKATNANDIELLKPIVSKALLNSETTDIAKLLQQASSVFVNTDYEVLNQFKINNTSTNVSNIVMSGMKDLNDYIIHYKPLNDEMFVSVLTVPNGPATQIITVVYGKYPEGWKVNILQYGFYKMNGKTAPELYQLAKKRLEEGRLIDAAFNMALASQAHKPGNAIWQYQKEEEMTKFRVELITTINNQYTFPIQLDEIETQPQIISISPMGLREGYIPMVQYLTKLDLKDTVATSIEYEKIHTTLGLKFKGWHQDKTHLFYKAMNQIPNGKTPVKTYGFVKNMKEEQL